MCLMLRLLRLDARRGDLSDGAVDVVDALADTLNVRVLLLGLGKVVLDARVGNALYNYCLLRILPLLQH